MKMNHESFFPHGSNQFFNKPIKPAIIKEPAVIDRMIINTHITESVRKPTATIVIACSISGIVVKYFLICVNVRYSLTLTQSARKPAKIVTIATIKYGIADRYPVVVRLNLCVSKKFKNYFHQKTLN